MKAIICLNGDPPSRHLAAVQTAGGYVIAADGACDYLARYGIKADCIVGDFDSFPFQMAAQCLKPTGIVCRHEPEKDYTDGQLALEKALEGHYDDIVFLGAMGGRADHQAENMRLLYEFADRCSIRAVSDSCEVSIIRDEAVICGCRGCTVSLLPYTDSALIEYSAGFKYPTVKLHLGRTESLSHSGLSNVMLGSTAFVVLSQGAVAAYVHRKY